MFLIKGFSSYAFIIYLHLSIYLDLTIKYTQVLDIKQDLGGICVYRLQTSVYLKKAYVLKGIWFFLTVL